MTVIAGDLRSRRDTSATSGAVARSAARSAGRRLDPATVVNAGRRPGLSAGPAARRQPPGIRNRAEISTITGTRSRNTPSSSRSRSAAGTPPASPTRNTSALMPSVNATSTAPLPSAAVPSSGNASATFHPVYIAPRIAARTNGHCRQRRLRQRVQAGVQRTDRKAFVRRRIQQPLRLGGQSSGHAGCSWPAHRLPPNATAAISGPSSLDSPRLSG